jgi:Protein of unknown function (DUF1353)
VEFGFHNQDLAVRTADGHNFVLLEALVYTTKDGRTIRVPIGGTSDGISTPRFIWNIISPFGPQWFPGILHDGGYRDTLEELQPDGTWEHVTLARYECDELIEEALLSHGVGEVETETIYKNLRLFGDKAFEADRAKKS